VTDGSEREVGREGVVDDGVDDHDASFPHGQRLGLAGEHERVLGRAGLRLRIPSFR